METDSLANPFVEPQNYEKNELENFLGQDDSPNETLEEKFSRLQLKERELLQKQEQLKQARHELNNRANWPKFLPIIYLDIENDIPSAAISLVKLSFIGIIINFFSNILNITSVSSVTGLKDYDHVSNIIFSVLQGIISVFFAYFFCFKKLYIACNHHDIPFSWLICQFIFLLWIIYQFIGFPSTGAAGFATFLDLLTKSDSTWSKTSSGLNTALMLISGIIEFIVLGKALKYQKVSGLEEPFI